MQSTSVIPRNILIVESDREVRELFETLLVNAGYDVSTASTPTAALVMAKSRVPDAIFSSLVFREMNGFELCRAFRAMPETANKVIVALTGYSASGVEATVLDAGFDMYMLKPVHIDTLVSLLNTIDE